MSKELKTIYVEKQEVNPRDFIQRSALEEDIKTLIKESCVVVDKATNELLIVYKELDFPTDEILWALDRIHYDTSERTRGLITTSKTFGYKPRYTKRSDYCSASELALSQPVEHAVVCKYGIQVGSLYAEHNSELYKAHMELVQGKVLDQYRLAETPFTSGIINKNNPLKYHYDAGNFKDVWSMMTVFKKDIQGGYLACPEYGIGFELKHNSVFFFEGQSILHGVTPIRKMSPRAARYSIVYYSMQQMWQCLPLDEEIIRIREVKTQREQKRYQRLVAEQAEVSHGTDTS